jgi:acetyl-CoA carboxylase biotin carboxylase subunit
MKPRAGAIARLLVANRGEIALRVMRSCREMGIETVAVYSDADETAPHVGAADRAVRIGPPPARESYLDIGRIIDAARVSGADAVHPGYGFLAENAAFARACEEARLTFVGPPSEVIARIGSKLAARALMSEAGVPIVPGEAPDDQTDAGIRRAIERVGLPVLVKASAGGGGKGMRVVQEPRGLDGVVQAARREAHAAFGDGTLYVERLIDRPHHVEVQVVADDFGHVVHLYERECSVQRRHQKVIEETPSPILSPEARRHLTEAALKAARAAGYRNAGTVEFLVDVGAADGHAFYFLEMNTRLQVEHPITEAVVGVDLVRAQLLVASGQPLPWSQSSLSQRGHAIEARVYAEDPSNDYLPQAGEILFYQEPAAPGLRIDSGVRQGARVPIHYDPLLAKVIAWAETRDAARRRLAAALRDFPILGVTTNIPYLVSIVEHAEFRTGSVDTHFLDSEAATLAPPGGDAPDIVRAAMEAHAAAPGRRGGASSDPWERLQGWRH